MSREERRSLILQISLRKSALNSSAHLRKEICRYEMLCQKWPLYPASRTHTHTLMRTHTITHTRAHYAHTHTHIRMHTHTRTHTYTHTWRAGRRRRRQRGAGSGASRFQSRCWKRWPRRLLCGVGRVWCVLVWCSVLQCVAVCRRVLQCGACRIYLPLSCRLL